MNNIYFQCILSKELKHSEHPLVYPPKMYVSSAWYKAIVQQIPAIKRKAKTIIDLSSIEYKETKIQNIIRLSVIII